jgi:hypothetical protein
MGDVDPDEFERARKLLGDAIMEEYRDAYLVQPVETAPGHWELWPIRKIRVTLEETRYWTYGTPGAGTGVLQAHIEFPYANHYRVKPKKGKPFDEATAAEAARAAHESSEGYGDDRGLNSQAAQRAYLMGYAAIADAPALVIEPLWLARETAVRRQRWEPWHEAIGAFFDDDRRVHPEKWGALEADLAFKVHEDEVSDKLHAMATYGAHDALDDWATEAGLTEPEGPA